LVKSRFGEWIGTAPRSISILGFVHVPPYACASLAPRGTPRYCKAWVRLASRVGTSTLWLCSMSHYQLQFSSLTAWESRTKPVTQILHAMSVSVNNTAAISNGLSPGAIAGVVIGILAGIILLLLTCGCTIIRVIFEGFNLIAKGLRNIPSIGERTHRTDINDTGQTSVTSPGTRDASPDTSVPPDPRLTLQAYRAERPARVRVGGEPRDRSGAQRSEHPPTPARSRPASPPHGYLASEADTDDIIQMARRDRGRAL
jgi:hypothetical protein